MSNYERLFQGEFAQYTPVGNEINDATREFMDSLISKYPDIDFNDLGSIVVNTCLLSCTTARMLRSVKALRDTQKTKEK